MLNVNGEMKRGNLEKAKGMKENQGAADEL